MCAILPAYSASDLPECTGLEFMLNKIAEQLQKTGYIVLRLPLPEALMQALPQRCRDDGRFLPAHVGRGENKQQLTAMRGDVISWLDEQDVVDSAYLTWMDELRSGLNERLFLGLFDYECHYAIYQPGTGYAVHLDALKGKRNRILTTVLYLNRDWPADAGGELLLYAPDSKELLATVVPEFGTMIIFLSEVFPHEVSLSRNIRRSITGWFRVR